MPEALAIRSLTKDYGRTRALQGVDLTIAPGELVGLLGPNGAGKSTLVKICTGLVRPTSGEVSVLGHPAATAPARAAIGYLAELFRFPGWLNADEVLDLHQRLVASEGGAAERARLLDTVGLSYASDRRVGEMSKGMQQRLGIAQALVGGPPVLILDEPTSALDPVGRRDVRALLLSLRASGTTVLLNSHLLGEVELVCDRVAIIRRGIVVAEGAPKDLAQPKGVAIETGSGIRHYSETERSDIPRLVAEIVSEGEDVYSVIPARPSLEDVYVSLVEGERE